MKKKRPVLNTVVSLRGTQPPRPECQKCHSEEVEEMYSTIPRWLLCQKCGHMWSNRTRYRDEERFRVLHSLQR